jgi:hypothetical protein
MLVHRWGGLLKSIGQMLWKIIIVSSKIPNFFFFFLEVISYNGLDHATENSLHKKIR